MSSYTTSANALPFTTYFKKAPGYPAATYLQLKSCLALLLVFWINCVSAQQQKASYWLTTADRVNLFTQQPQALLFVSRPNKLHTITIDASQRFQTMDGFGFALTGGSAGHLINMSKASRTALLQELFGTGNNDIGISYLRLSIGASDLNEKVFSYNDLPKGQTDETLQHFDLGPDKQDVIPIMKEILAIAPGIKILGSPWSPPAWMKTIYDARGGRLQSRFFPAYARYFVKYLQAMAAEGIRIDAITVQNEPLHPGNNPSLLMPAPDQAEFIRDHLGPALLKARLHTKIIIYDHNADRPDYPIDILNDKAARKFIDGSGFHLYGGDMKALTDVHNAHPDKHLYFTEQMVVEKPGFPKIRISDPVSRLMIGAPLHWTKNVLLWNLAADSDNKPFTNRGGCGSCQGAVTIDGDSVGRNLAYYVMAHSSKLVRPGSVRIFSGGTNAIAHVAYAAPNGQVVLVVANNGEKDQDVNISYKGKLATAHLPKGAVATYTW